MKNNALSEARSAELASLLSWGQQLCREGGGQVDGQVKLLPASQPLPESTRWQPSAGWLTVQPRRVTIRITLSDRLAIAVMIVLENGRGSCDGGHTDPFPQLLANSPFGGVRNLCGIAILRFFSSDFAGLWSRFWHPAASRLRCRCANPVETESR